MNKLTLKRKIALTLFGLTVGLLLIESFMRFGEFIILKNRSFTDATKLKKNTIRILCLGDSFTYGIGVEKDEAYPAQLERALNKLNKQQTYTVINRGFPGINSSLLLSELKRNISETCPDIVTILIGGNDHSIYKGINSTSHLKMTQLLKNISNKTSGGNIPKRTTASKAQPLDPAKSKKPLQDFQELTGSKQNDVNHLVFLGNLYRSKAEYARSFPYYKHALEIDPSNAPAKLELLRALKLDNQPLKAIELAFEIINSPDCGPEVYLELVNIAQNISNPWQFIYMCNQASDVFIQNKPNFSSLNLKTIRTFEMKQKSRKKEQLQKLLETAGIYYGLKSYDKSFDYLQKVYKLFQRVCIIDKQDFTKCPDEVKYELLRIMRHEIGDSIVYNNLADIALICKQQNLRLILLGYPEYLPYSLEKISQEYSLELLDIRKNFPRQPKDRIVNEYFLRDDSHCSIKGNYQIADCLAKQIIPPVSKKKTMP